MIKKQYLINAINAALEAGAEILEVYARDFEVEQKKDNSPLTEADKASNNVIVERLESTDIPIISEEIKNIPYDRRADWKDCWIVDPLDGTKEFIKRNGEFTVNIALVSNGVPVAGVVYIPVSGTLYFAAEELGSFSINLEDKQELPEWEVLLEKADKLPTTEKYDKYTIVASRSHL
ncbi:MAG TPA: 3'(2'),5'-bisphosphate nucleotidase CysQ, partial [Chitinophagaceae bacterium]|nr:3'(2'),5'-bisphosphate nucleotidase CysQ [Chitinophagaceae bacterium]